MPVTLYFRPEDDQVMPEPLASWESPAFMMFPSVQTIQDAADAQGLRALFYDGSEALFPRCEAGTAWFWADAEEEVWELACELTQDPEDATTWPTGYELLHFLTFWRLALNAPGAHLELVHTQGHHLRE